MHHLYPADESTRKEWLDRWCHLPKREGVKAVLDELRALPLSRREAVPRMKGCGMRWGTDGADEMSHLRALLCSGEQQWDAYWHPNGN